MAKTATYKCNQCGTRLVVNETLESHLSPIYCCGEEVSEVSSTKKKTAAPRKKKAAGKKIAAKKKTAPPKKLPKKQ